MAIDEVASTFPKDGLGATQRRDSWWLSPLAVAVGLGLFGVYSSWAAFQGNYYRTGPYLSPFYSPLFLFDWWRFSPAFLILWAPLGFRLTCYYYRKAYYRAYFLDPPACSVGEPCGRHYRGETAFPWILQNLHRYFLYLAILFVIVLAYDAVWALVFDGAFGIGIGSLIMLVNVILLSLYTFSCHSLRHLVGGRLDCFAEAAFGGVRYWVWRRVSALNRRHILWAWLSLFQVGFTDLYIRLVAMGYLIDVRLS